MPNVPVAGLVLTIAVSALTAWFVAAHTNAPDLAPPTPDRAAALEHDRPGVAGDESALRRELETVRARLQALTERLATLEQRPTDSLRTPALDAVTTQDFVAFQHEVRAALGRAQPPGIPAPELKTQVAEALKDVQKDRAVASVSAAAEKRSALLEQRVAAWTETLQLDPVQAANLRTVLASRDARDREVLRLWQEGADDRVLGETKQAFAQEFETAIASILTPAQAETFRAGAAGDGKPRASGGK